MRRRTYVAMVGSTSLAGCVGRLGGTEERTATPTDSGSFQQLWETDLEDGEMLDLSDYQATADAETAYLGTQSELTVQSTRSVSKPGTCDGRRATPIPRPSHRSYWSRRS